MIVGRDFWQEIDPGVAVMVFASLALSVIGLMWSLFYLFVRLLGWVEAE